MDWSIDKKKIKDAVFISSKSYGIKYINDSETIKIKGFDNENIKFNNLKKMFYDKEKEIEFNENFFISKSDIELFQIKNKKKMSLNSYDKRKFYDDFKKTKPLEIYKYSIYK